MRVLADPAETGAVTIALPQDVQAESYDYPAHFFDKRVYTIERTGCSDGKRWRRGRADPRRPAAA